LKTPCYSEKETPPLGEEASLKLRSSQKPEGNRLTSENHDWGEEPTIEADVGIGSAEGRT